MTKRSVHTNITPLPEGLSRETVMATLRNHVEMIDLNPLVIGRHTIPPPPHSTPEETTATWYEITDRITYVPGLASSSVTYTGCFHDLPDGLQTHVHAPMGLEIRSRWLLGGNLPGEPAQPVELGLGIPRHGLWLREDVDMRCNVVLTAFVKKTLKKAHSTLVDRMLEKANRSSSTTNADADDAASLPPRLDHHQQKPFQISMATASSAGASLAGDSTSRLSDGYADSAASLHSGARPYPQQPRYQKPLPAPPAGAPCQGYAGQDAAERYGLAATNNLDHYPPRPASNHGRVHNPAYADAAPGPRQSQHYPLYLDQTPQGQLGSRPVELPAQGYAKPPMELPAHGDGKPPMELPG